MPGFLKLFLVVENITANRKAPIA